MESGRSESGMGPSVGRPRAPALLLALLVLGAEAGALPDPLPSDICQLPKVVGRCRAAFQRWWYNATSQACQRFIFGGCRGNLNNFLEEQDCHQACVPAGDVTTTVAPDQRAEETMTPTVGKAVSKSGRRLAPGDNWPGFQDFCAVAYEVGHCRASFPRWYFDIETRTCKMFIYGGCGGNRNNYLAKEHCLDKCMGNREIPEEHIDPDNHVHHFADPLVHSTRAVVLAVLLAVMAAVLLGSTVIFLVKMCRKNPGVSLGTVWSTLDDKEYLMSNAYTL